MIYALTLFAVPLLMSGKTAPEDLVLTSIAPSVLGGAAAVRLLVTPQTHVGWFTFLTSLTLVCASHTPEQSS